MSYNNGYNRRPTFRERVERFMMGRNGPDALGKFIFTLWIILAIVNLFIESWVIAIIESLLAIYYIFRYLSRNVYKRQRENAFYIKVRGKVKAPFVMLKNRWRDRKTHVYKKCPNCKSTLRLPKIKGTHVVKCVRCAHRFDIYIK